MHGNKSVLDLEGFNKIPKFELSESWNSTQGVCSILHGIPIKMLIDYPGLDTYA